MRGFFILLVLALLVVLARWAGWFDITGTDAGGRSSVTATIDKDEVKRDVNEAEQSIRNIGNEDDRGDLTPSPATNLLSLDKDRIEIAPGQSAEIIVTRAGSLDKEPLKIRMSDGSGLKTEVSGFEEGQQTNVVVVRAPEGAAGGMIAIEYKGETQAVEIDVTTRTDAPNAPER